MTYANMERRVGKLESRVADIEDSHGETLYKLTRRAKKSDIMDERLVDGINHLGRGIALMMEQMRIHPIDIPTITVPSEEEIDAALEEGS